MSTQYSLTVYNKSTNSGHMVVYQTDPQQGTVSDLFSLAWFSKSCHPDTNVRFTWTIDYDFVWSETGEVRPGVLFVASQTRRTDPSNTAVNGVTLNYRDGAYLFEDPIKDTAMGKLGIYGSGAVPLKKAAVGVGMSGAGTFVQPAQPNMNMLYTPHPEYWVCFGNYQEGEVMDINTVTNAYNVKFAANEYSRIVTLQQDNTWKSENLQQFNQNQLVRAKRS